MTPICPIQPMRQNSGTGRLRGIRESLVLATALAGSAACLMAFAAPASAQTTFAVRPAPPVVRMNRGGTRWLVPSSAPVIVNGTHYARAAFAWRPPSPWARCGACPRASSNGLVRPEPERARRRPIRRALQLDVHSRRDGHGRLCAVRLCTRTRSPPLVRLRYRMTRSHRTLILTRAGAPFLLCMHAGRPAR